MALVVATLQADILAAMNAAFADNSDNPAGAQQAFAAGLAAAIDKFVKSGQVQTTVTTPAGPGTGVGKVV